MKELEDLGFVSVNKKRPNRFFVTPLSKLFLNIQPPAQSHVAPLPAEVRTSEASKHFLVIEPNFKVFAYTTNPTFRQLIHELATVQMEFPNMLAGKIDREKTIQAFQKGLTAEQIKMFLNEHAHRMMH